jgi:pimeloyl-ACP methyl ester carboxylesterase
MLTISRRVNRPATAISDDTPSRTEGERHEPTLGNHHPPAVTTAGPAGRRPDVRQSQHRRTVIQEGGAKTGARFRVTVGLVVLAAVASLSGELRLEGRRDIRADVKRVHIPVLYLGSREDPLTAGTRQPREFQRLLRSADAHVRVFDGSEHGVALFQAAAGNSARRLLMAFLDAHR